MLIASRGLRWRKDEGAEIQQLILGVLEAAEGDSRIEVVGTDLRRAYRLERGPDGLDVFDIGSLGHLLRRRIDVVHIHFVLSPLTLVFALVARLRGAAVVLSPMSMLADDFASGSWFARHRGTRRKRMAIAALRTAYRVLVHRYVCVSEHEVAQSRLPVGRTVLAPLARPDSPLGAAAGSPSGPLRGDGNGPLAFVSRLDVHRKGMDRLALWLLAHADDLPRPAVRLYAPPEDDLLPTLAALVESGLVEWDATTQGRDLIDGLRSCRGLVLLSRWEGHPRILREGSLLGLPTLTTQACNFAQVVHAIGGGVVVDGDDVDDVQRGFVALADATVDGDAIDALFDRTRIGAFLLAHMRALALRTTAPPRSYYDIIKAARQGRQVDVK